MKKQLVSLSIALLLPLQNNVAHASAHIEKKEAAKAGVMVTAGAAAGGAAFSTLGSAGLAIGGTAVSIGAAPFVAVGATFGMAGYGIYRLFRGSPPTKSAPATDQGKPRG